MCGLCQPVSKPYRLQKPAIAATNVSAVATPARNATVTKRLQKRKPGGSLYRLQFAPRGHAPLDVDAKPIFAPVGAHVDHPRSPHWGKVRAAFIAANPSCAVCGKRDLLNAHHVKPFHLFPKLELEPSNLITLCEGESVNCHLLFGHLRSWLSYNPAVRRDAAIWANKLKSRK